jgi:hypothetical protein
LHALALRAPVQGAHQRTEGYQEEATYGFLKEQKATLIKKKKQSFFFF